MNRVHYSDDQPVSAVVHVAVAICSIDGSQRHIGILHRDTEADQVLLLDLAWHHRLRNEPLGGSWLWVEPAVNARRLVQVAAICRRVWRSNRLGIPYALSHPTECFDENTGAFLLGPTRLGLTCASFVLAMFDAAGLPLAQYDTWPTNRDGDAEWQLRIVEKLAETAASAKHVHAVSIEIGSVRFRPEEVAGAATTSPLPAGFDVAADRAAQILALLSKVA